MLPSPYNIGQPVVAVLMPMDWRLNEGCTKDKKHRILAAVSPDEEKIIGLQIMDPDMRMYLDHRDLFRHYEIPMMNSAYIGPLTGLPQQLLLDEDMTCLIFVRDEYWRRPLDLKRVWKPQLQENRC